MTSLRHIPARTASVDTAAQTSRVEQQTLTESILVRFAGCHDVDECCGLRQQAVLLNLFLADGIAARHAGRGVDWDDLVQVARLGLLKAVVGYRAGKGAGFAASAIPTIAGEIKRYFRDYCWMIRPPRRLQELLSELRLVEPDLLQRLHRTPSAVELALALGVKAEELSDALVAAAGYTALSLDLPAHVDPSLSLGDGMRAEGDPYTLVERAECLRPALAGLSVRERQIIRMRLVDCLTQGQIGRELGVSQMQVFRLLTTILSRLRDDLGTTLNAAMA